MTLTPTDAIADTEMEAESGTDTLVATSTRGDPGDDHQRLCEFEFELVDEPDDRTESQRLITEQLLRHSQLWDAVALAAERDVPTVRIEEYNGTHPAFGHDSDGRYEYRDQYYRVRTAELE
ncbi:hypothetical protein [Natrialba asiatica]|uniref:Uncharacterized protein n=1 Tax=Natrialba asiatica (strain ATCC 700177 / DSM 12278 / JCM 9576 / FERM P-10747 / NBRC 102637 / 172P1) TaxID=29540 RepID=M0AZY0_NATA1|nr:hypothetical protein [Natrialba asiatica]ELZ03503.1 hypothetical protein C481_05180 [Natrialba asiatica DSM 12278]